jgi:MFS family permease
MFVIGFTLNGGMTALYALVSQNYPIEIRATGVGWCIGVGRLGAILSPFVAGVLVERGWSLYSLIIALAMPAALIGSFVVIKTDEKRPSPRLATS